MRLLLVLAFALVTHNVQALTALEQRYVNVMARFVAPIPKGQHDPCDISSPYGKECNRVMRAAHDALTGNVGAERAVAAAEAFANKHKLPRPANAKQTLLNFALQYELATRPPGFPPPPGALDYVRPSPK